MAPEGPAAVLGADCSGERHAKGQHFKRLNNEERTCGPLVTAPVIVRSRATAQQRGSFRQYLTQRLEQFRSNLSLRALTYSLLSWEDIFFFLLETMTRLFPSVSWSLWIYERGEIILHLCFGIFFFFFKSGPCPMSVHKRVSFPTHFIGHYLFRYHFCSHRPNTCTNSFTFSVAVVRWHLSPTAVIPIAHNELFKLFFSEVWLLFLTK